MTLPPAPDFRLDGHRALVVGASSGIGLGCAVALAAQGAAVTLAARRADRLEQAVAALRDGGHGAEALALDVTETDTMRAALDARAPYDILVNAAGIARHGPATDTAEDDFDAVMAVNHRAAHLLAGTVARRLIAEGRPGSIVTISSQMGHVAGPDRSVYAASKHAVEGMTKAMAIEWGPHGIRVNTVCPTFVLTELTAPILSDPEVRAWVEGKIKLPRLAEVQDISSAVAFLCSPAAAMITGTSLLVDGGWTAG